MSVQPLPSYRDAFSDWYNEVIMRAELADIPPRVPEQLRGMMVLRPYGYALWENLQGALDAMFKATGHQNAYFPMLIPMSFIAREKEHVEGFRPELAVVTHGGGEELAEPLVVRPTSETLIGHMYAQWIRTYRDLPVLINQWGSVLRWEKRTKAFIRTAEFLWQEGHTAHATEAEAEEETLRMLGTYRTFAEEWGAVPVLTGRKSESEKFAGALRTYTIEALMPDGRALQSGTSHNLGQNFARAFDIQYQDRDNSLKHCWTTSWGLSWRMLGAVIGMHGDDQGLVLPPRLAPIQVVFVPIWRSDEERAAVMSTVDNLRQALPKDVRGHVDNREGLTPGFKFNDWEMRGVPLRVEVGPKDVDKRQVVLARRDVRDRAGKEFVTWDQLGTLIPARLTEIQAALFKRAIERTNAMTRSVATWDEFVGSIPASGGFGFVRAYWDGSAEDEAQVKAETGATIRAFPFDQPSEPGRCLRTGREATQVAAFARAY